MQIIHAYTRREALEDGFLVDVSELARELGYRIPVAVTHAVFSEFVRVPEGVEAQDETGRLWDILSMCLLAIRAKHPTDDTSLYFKLVVQNRQKSVVTLRAVCGPDDDGKPCLTIMLPEED